MYMEIKKNKKVADALFQCQSPLFYIIENCSEAIGHRSLFIYDAVCPDKCRPLPAYCLPE